MNLSQNKQNLSQKSKVKNEFPLSTTSTETLEMFFMI